MTDNTATESTVNNAQTGSAGNEDDGFLDSVLASLSPNEDDFDDEQALVSEQSDVLVSGKPDVSVSEQSDVQKNRGRGQERIRYLTEERRKAELLANEYATKLAEKEKAVLEMQNMLEAYEKAWQELQTNGFVQDAKPTQQQQTIKENLNSEAEKKFSPEEIKAQIKKELTAEIKEKNDLIKLVKTWEPHLARAKTEMGEEFKNFFGSFAKKLDSDKNAQRLMKLVGGMQYAPETLFAANKLPNFRDLPFEDQAAEALRLNNQIVLKKTKVSQSSPVAQVPSGKSTSKQPQSVAEYRAMLEARRQK